MAKTKAPDAALIVRTAIAIRLQAIETDCYNLGMVATARKINSAVQEAGWEIERLISTTDSKGGE